jgi:uncharacterized membrane protein (DUF373 family)
MRDLLFGLLDLVLFGMVFFIGLILVGIFFIPIAALIILDLFVSFFTYIRKRRCSLRWR